MKLRFDTWHFYWSDSNPFFLSNFAIYFSVCFTIFQKLARWRKNCQKGGCVKPSSKVPFINKSKKCLLLLWHLIAPKFKPCHHIPFLPDYGKEFIVYILNKSHWSPKFWSIFHFERRFTAGLFTQVLQKNYIISLLFIITHKLRSGKNFIVFSSW